MPGAFVLYGGTAIALQLGHRQSADFHFFGNRAFDPTALIASMAFLAQAVIARQERNALSVTVDRGGTVRLSFHGLPGLVRVAPPLMARDNGLKVAALIDLAATKALVVQQRAEARDYLDLDAIIEEGGIDLASILAAARTIYAARFDPLITLKALSYFEDGTLPRLPVPVKDRLARAAREIDLDRLPETSEGFASRDTGPEK